MWPAAASDQRQGRRGPRQAQGRPKPVPTLALWHWARPFADCGAALRGQQQRAKQSQQGHWHQPERDRLQELATAVGLYGTWKSWWTPTPTSPRATGIRAAVDRYRRQTP